MSVVAWHVPGITPIDVAWQVRRCLMQWAFDVSGIQTVLSWKVKAAMIGVGLFRRR